MAMELAKATELVPYDFPRRLRKELNYEQAQRLMQEHLSAVVRELRLSHAYKMQGRIIEMHVELGERIADKLAETDNPLVHDALKRTFQNWLARAEAIVGGL